MLTKNDININQGHAMNDSLLGISLFQQSAPELVLSERFGENQLVVACGDAVIHNHIDPFTITPELSDRKVGNTSTGKDKIQMPLHVGIFKHYLIKDYQ